MLSLIQLEDRFGSPSTADVETFARAFDAELDAALGDFAGQLEREVSSPVRLRTVRQGIGSRLGFRVRRLHPEVSSHMRLCSTGYRVCAEHRSTCGEPRCRTSNGSLSQQDIGAAASSFMAEHSIRISPARALAFVSASGRVLHPLDVRTQGSCRGCIWSR